MCSGARRRTAYWLRRPLTLTDYGTHRHRGTLSTHFFACMRPLSAHCWPLTLLSQKSAIDHSIDELSTALRIAEGRLQPTYSRLRANPRPSPDRVAPTAAAAQQVLHVRFRLTTIGPRIGLRRGSHQVVRPSLPFTSSVVQYPAYLPSLYNLKDLVQSTLAMRLSNFRC